MPWHPGILNVNLEHFAHVWRKKGIFGEKINPVCDCTLSNQMPWTDQITDF